jgi:hypothetical protein
MHPNECVKWYLAVLAVLVVPIRPPNGMSRWEHDPYGSDARAVQTRRLRRPACQRRNRAQRR